MESSRYHALLKFIEQRLTSRNFQLFKALSDAFNDKSNLSALEAIESWKAQEPIPLNEPWQ